MADFLYTWTLAVEQRHVRTQINSYHEAGPLIKAATEKNRCLSGASVRSWIAWNVEEAARLVQAEHLGFLALEYAVLEADDVNKAAADVERILLRAKGDPIEFLTHFDAHYGDDDVNSAFQRALRTGIVHLSPSLEPAAGDGDTTWYLVAFLQGLLFILREAQAHQLAVVHVKA